MGLQLVGVLMFSVGVFGFVVCCEFVVVLFVSSSYFMVFTFVRLFAFG